MAYLSQSPLIVAQGGTGLVSITAHNLIVGNGTSAPNLLAPSATTGVAVVSQGASADPHYGTVVVAGGGTGLTSLTAHDLLIGNGTSNVTLLAPNATSGIPLVSQGSSADPAYTTAVVAGGGTGNTTFTAYSVICAGTTSTGAFQNVSGVGSSGQVLTSNGASALPSWQAASGGSTLTITTVNNGASPYTVLSGDQFLAVDSSAGTVSILLPNAPTTGRVIYVKDSTGTAATNNITVTTVGGAVNIDGATTYVMNSAYQSVNVVFDGAAYQIF